MTGDLVGVRGFEPPAPASRTQCSTRLSYTPTVRAAIARARACGKRPCLTSEPGRSRRIAGAGACRQPLQRGRHARTTSNRRGSPAGRSRPRWRPRSAASSAPAARRTSQIRIGLSCRPSWRQVRISKVSSKVPRPPGRVTNASDSSNMRRLRLCMLSVTISSDSPLVRHLAPGQEVRDHADHLAAARQRRIGHAAHQADPPAAVDKPDAGRGQPAAERVGGVATARVGAGLGAAEHGNGLDLRHDAPAPAPAGRAACPAATPPAQGLWCSRTASFRFPCESATLERGCNAPPASSCDGPKQP